MDNNTNAVGQKKRIVISISEYLHKLWEWMPVIICWTVLCAMSVVTLSKVIKEPTYAAETKIYILSRQIDENMDRLDMSDLEVSAQMSDDSMLLFYNKQLLEKVISSLKSNADSDFDMFPDELTKMIDISREDDSLMVNITVRNPDPYLACEIANTYRKTVVEELEEKLMVRGITTVEEAAIPLWQSGRSDSAYAVIGAVFGIISIVFLLFAVYVAFDAQREPEDLKEI